MNYQKKLKEYQQKDNQKVRQISLVLLMKQNIVLQKYFKIIYYLYQQKNTLNISVALVGLNRGNQLRNLNTDFILANCLFRSVKLTKNADLDKDKYGGYGEGFDSCSKFSLPASTIRKMSLFSELT